MSDKVNRYRKPLTTYAQAVERCSFLEMTLVDDHGICEDCAGLLADLRVFLQSAAATSPSGRVGTRMCQATAISTVLNRYPDAIYTSNPCKKYKPGVWTCSPEIKWLGEDWEDAAIRLKQIQPPEGRLT